MSYTDYVKGNYFSANGNAITEVGDLNTDGTPVMFSHIVTTVISKTNKVQVYITTTYGRS